MLPSAWTMRWKWNLTTNKITNYKARLNIHGGKQTDGANYYETYTPVVAWFVVGIMIVFAILFSWSLKQFDFAMACPQAPIEQDVYMDLPHGIITQHDNSREHILNLNSNICGQK